ncbi:MAG: phosphoenolpyruvate--protein phosphotransferase [Rhodoluna sp.]|nr:phosphoenolpyruvate--protein phosphotransferase [Rhodoluna sp.]
MSLAARAVLPGLGVGLNSAVGEVFIVKPQAALPEWSKSKTSAAEETAALKTAIANVAANLAALGERAGGTSAEIFEALTSLLEDEELFEVAESHLEEGWSAAAAFGKAVDTFAELLGGDADFDERVNDLQDLSKRVQADIAGIEMALSLPEIGRIVLVGDDFSPADTAQFTKAVVGVITLKGGPTSHTAIICRSRSIPAVVSCGAAAALENGDTVLVDPVGDRVLFGGDETLATKAIQFVAINDEPIIPVRVNIGTLNDAENATAKTDAVGVGLFRTELLYLNSRIVPTVEEQASEYANILAAAPKGPIVVRTIDAGSDKPVPFLHMPHEENPALGVRGFRLIQDHRKFIEDQLKSLEIARVKTGREVWVMAPMIATVQEAKQFCNLARSLGGYKVGIMVETPSIAALIDQLAGIVDFVSVGTNDLSQYLFAADRMNANLGSLSNHWQPGLIRTLARIADGATKGGFSVGVCGESASDPAFAVVLAGLGINSVSVSVSQVGAVRASLSALDIAKAKEVANKVLVATSPEDAKAAALDALSQL